MATPALTLQVSMQTAAAGDVEASGFCREEFQAFMRYFASPLIQQAIKKRYKLRESGTLPLWDGMTYREIVRTWRKKLTGAFECIMPGDTKVHKVPKTRWRAFPHVDTEAYRPTTGPGQWPFFVTLDRSTAHSFWLIYHKEHLLHPGVPLLQILRICPRGHDLHQIVEHAIGCIKSHVYKCLGEINHQFGRPLRTEDARRAVLEGAELYGPVAWSNNLPRLLDCLKLVSADWGVEVELEVVEGAVTRTIVQFGTGGNYCPPKKS